MCGFHRHTGCLWQLWDILIQKLNDLGIPYPYITFIYNLISNRVVHYRYNDIDSIRIVDRGLPQGCVLSPTLYTIYVSDLEKLIAERSKVQIIQFANDVCLYTINKLTAKTIRDLEASIALVADFFENLGLTIAPSKSQLCIFNRISPKCNLHWSITVRNQIILASFTVNFLGLTLQNN